MCAETRLMNFINNPVKDSRQLLKKIRDFIAVKCSKNIIQNTEQSSFCAVTSPASRLVINEKVSFLTDILRVDNGWSVFWQTFWLRMLMVELSTLIWLFSDRHSESWWQVIWSYYFLTDILSWWRVIWSVFDRHSESWWRVICFLTDILRVDEGWSDCFLWQTFWELVMGDLCFLTDILRVDDGWPVFWQTFWELMMVDLFSDTFWELVMGDLCFLTFWELVMGDLFSDRHSESWSQVIYVFWQTFWELITGDLHFLTDILRDGERWSVPNRLTACLKNCCSFAMVVVNYWCYLLWLCLFCVACSCLFQLVLFYI